MYTYNIYRRTRKTWKRTSTATSRAGNLNQRHVRNNSQSGNSTQREPEPASAAAAAAAPTEQCPGIPCARLLPVRSLQLVPVQCTSCRA